jgi:hypothetical protein
VVCDFLDLTFQLSLCWVFLLFVLTLI